MKCLSKKLWLLAWITGLPIILSLAGVTHAENQSAQTQRLSAPLHRNHPDAKLDPSLLNVPAMPEPNLDQPRSGPLPRNHPDAKLDPSLLNVPAMPEPNLDRPRSGPLPRNHPDAKLDPRLLNVPAMPEPQEGKTPNTSRPKLPVKGTSYDTRTGTTRVDAIAPVPNRSSPNLSPPHIGSDANVQPGFGGIENPQ